MHPVMRTTVLAGWVVGLVVVAGCEARGVSGSVASSAVVSSVATSVTPSSVGGRRGDLTSQGFVVKELGQVAGIDCTGGIDTCAIRFSVEGIEVNPTCHQYGVPAGVGRKTLLLHVSMVTGELSEDGSRIAPAIFDPFSLNGIADDGFVQEGRPGSCGDRDRRLS